jgi:hypothetical protein
MTSIMFVAKPVGGVVGGVGEGVRQWESVKQ